MRPGRARCVRFVANHYGFRNSCAPPKSDAGRNGSLRLVIDLQHVTSVLVTAPQKQFSARLGSGSLLVAMAAFWYAGDAAVHAFCAWGSGRCRDLAIAFCVAIRSKAVELTAATAVLIAGRAPVGCDSAVSQSAPRSLLSRYRWPRCSAMGCLVHAAACASYFIPQQTRLAPPLAIPSPPFRRDQPSSECNACKSSAAPGVFWPGRVAWSPRRASLETR